MAGPDHRRHQAQPSSLETPEGQSRAAHPQAQPVPQSSTPPVTQDRSFSSRKGGAGYPQRTGQPDPVSPGRPAVAPEQPATPVPARPVPVAGGGERTMKVRHEDDGPEEELEGATYALRNAPPWLVSALFHMLLMIVLGLVVMANVGEDRVELQAVYAEKLGEQLEFDSFLAGNDEDKVEEPVLTPEDLMPVDNPFAAPPKVDIVPRGMNAVSDTESAQIGMALQGREEGMKRALLAAYGGNATTEGAVQLGLQWLAKYQRRDGSWSLVGPYPTGAADASENRRAATAMALLAFQGAGNTDRHGKFHKHVADGWDWLLKQQDGDGCFFHEGPYHHRFYTQGQCSIAICELYGMTKEARFKEPAERSIQYILKSQSNEGGWRYSPKVDSDLSVTGWILMALQSARMAGLDVPQENLRRVERFLDKIALAGGSRYPYRRGEKAKLSMTAEGLLCRQYLGWKQSDPRLIEGLEYITSPENLISFEENRDAYYWYYATQAAHHMEGEYWKRWNEVMRQAIPEQQVKRGGQAGSWNPLEPTRDQWEAHGGRLYVTCLHIYMLEVYYRHLPLYSKVYSYIDSLNTTP